MVLSRGTITGLILIALTATRAAWADEPEQVRSRSIWDGVYTQEQAARGRIAYADPCGKCHGYRLDGAPDDPDMFSTPPVAGPKFLRDWDGQTLGALFGYTRTTMPANNPGFLSMQEFVDVLAYMLAASGVPAGETDLPADSGALGGMLIEARRR